MGSHDDRAVASILDVANIEGDTAGERPGEAPRRSAFSTHGATCRRSTPGMSVHHWDAGRRDFEVYLPLPS